MRLRKIRLELARTKEAPQGHPNCGYEIVAPLDDDGRLDESAWRKNRAACSVRRFWKDADVERGVLVYTRAGKWVFSYAPGEEDDETLFKLDRHIIKAGEYVSVTEHDGVTQPFRIVSVSDFQAATTADGGMPRL